MITPAVVTYLTARLGWQSSFAVIGSAGFIWVAAWLILVKGELRGLLAPPSRQKVQVDPLEAAPTHPRLAGSVTAAFIGVLCLGALVATAGFRYGMAAVQVGIAVAIIGPLLVAIVIPRDGLEGAAWAASLGEIVRNRRFWILVVVSVSINICWHFLVNWIPSYLKQERGMKFEAGNLISTIPFLAADAGNLLGGWLSRQLTARGRSAVQARLLVMGGAAPLIMSGLGIGLAVNIPAAVVVLSIIAAGTATFMVNYFAFTQEVMPRHTGLVVGFLGARHQQQPVRGGVPAVRRHDEGPDRQPRAGLRDHRPGSAARAGGPFSWAGACAIGRPPRRNESTWADFLARSGWTPGGLPGKISPARLFAVASTFAPSEPFPVGLPRSGGRGQCLSHLARWVEHDPSILLAQAVPGCAVLDTGGLRDASLVAPPQGRR